jgi:hypothetical protein
VITLCYVTSPTRGGVTFKFKTLKGAQSKAHQLLGVNPKRDPDGYAVSRTTGNCIFIREGCTFEELFPEHQPLVTLQLLDPGWKWPKKAVYGSTEGAIEALNRGDHKHYLAATITDDHGRPTHRCTREVGETRWSVLALP